VARLAPRTVRPSRYHVLPHVTDGEYYVARSPATGRTRYIYPRLMQERFFPIVDGGYSPLSPLADADDPADVIQSSLFRSASDIADAFSQTAEQAARQVDQQALAQQARSAGANINQLVSRQQMLQSASAGRTVLFVGAGALGALALGWLMWGRR